MRLLRRPLLLAFVLGCGISILASGRLTLRLIVDGMLSFAFVPACQLAGLAAVYRARRAPLTFSEAADRFFEGNSPWLWLLVATMAAADGRLAVAARTDCPVTVLDRMSQVLGLSGLTLFVRGWRRRRES